MDLTACAEMFGRQAGVASRQQLLEAGTTDADIRRWGRNRLLTRVHPGVYVDHTGPLTWTNRAWAAVLYLWPAALTHCSAVDRGGDVIHVAVDSARTPRTGNGIRVHRLTDLEERVQWHVGPPRVRLEDALLSMSAEAKDRHQALAIVADACRRRLTTPARLAQELTRRPRIKHRAWLLQVLQEAADGVQSVLESSYRCRVERAHALPRPDRQCHERTEHGVVYRDATYRRFRLVVELDGRVGHELSADRWDDQDRDLLVATADVMTLRLGWRHCEATPCRTAARLAQVFARRGWRGQARPCSSGCPVA